MVDFFCPFNVSVESLFSSTLQQGRTEPQRSEGIGGSCSQAAAMMEVMKSPCTSPGHLRDLSGSLIGDEFRGRALLPSIAAEKPKAGTQDTAHEVIKPFYYVLRMLLLLLARLRAH